MSLVVTSTKTNPTSLPFSLRTDGGPVLYPMSVSSEIGTCAPVGAGTSTCLDRHPKEVRHARRFDVGVDFGEKLVPCHSFAPFVRWLQRDDRLEHRQRRRISRRFGLTCLAEHRRCLRNLFQLSILYLKNF